MKKKSDKILSLTLCAALLAGGIAATVFAIDGDQEQTANAAPLMTTAAPKAAASSSASKDETVYVLSDAEGTVKEIIVSDWLQNSQGAAQLSDVSELVNIENVKGDETCSDNGSSTKIWDAQGSDIYYTGKTGKELPVNMTVSYQLNGSPISAADLAGKSGKVTIRFDYENRLYEMLDVGGKQEQMFVPFAVVTGLILDNDVFRNVAVTNGRFLNDGDRTVVVGFALPGMQENLALDPDTLEIPSSFEITADVTNFSLGMTISLATNEVFRNLDSAELDTESLSGSLSELTGGLGQLMDGSSELYEGLATLLEKSSALVDGIDQLAYGAQQFSAGANEFDDGANKASLGMGELYNGLNQIDANSYALVAGAREIFEAVIENARNQIVDAGLSVPILSIDNYAEVLNNVITSLDNTDVYQVALSQVTAAVEANRSLIEDAVEEAAREEVLTQVISTVTLGLMNKGTYDAALEGGWIDPATKALIDYTVEQQMQSSEVRRQIAENVEIQVKKAISENMASDAVQMQMASASEGASSLIDLKASLDNFNAFYLGLQQYTNGVTSAAYGAGVLMDGIDELRDGAAQLSDGAAEIYQGALAFKEGTPELIEGIRALTEGARQLKDGMKQFGEEGLQKLLDAFDENLGGIVERFDLCTQVAKDYQNFSGISPDMQGQVKFIYRTDEIIAE